MISNLRQNPGKSIIFHNDVVGTGVLTIKEMLIINGHTEYGSKPTADSICYICGVK